MTVGSFIVDNPSRVFEAGTHDQEYTVAQIQESPSTSRLAEVADEGNEISHSVSRDCARWHKRHVCARVGVFEEERRIQTLISDKHHYMKNKIQFIQGTTIFLDYLYSTTNKIEIL